MDTNIVIALFNGNKEIAEFINKQKDFAINSVILGEIYVGIYGIPDKLKEFKVLDDFLKNCKVLDIDKETARHYGEIMAFLYKKGRPIPTNDVWIAATAKKT